MKTPFGDIPDRHLENISMTEAHEYLVSRRRFLRTSAAAAAGALAGPVLWQRAGRASTPIAGRHLQFGNDPRTHVFMAWGTADRVDHPVMDLGTDPSYGATLDAHTRTVAGSGTNYHHVQAIDLDPGTEYHYRLRHDGGPPVTGTFRTAPAEPQPFTFTSFGDQGVSGSARATTSVVLANDPALHFHVGDLCYAYTYGTGDPVKQADLAEITRPRQTNQATWDQWFAMIEPQASRAPWMPVVGNHEMEYGYGSLGYDGTYARFSHPYAAADGTPITYYDFRYGNVGFVALDANDASDEIPSNRGYTGGAQDAWLRQALTSLRSDAAIDFIVVGFHHCAYCSNAVHASDGGVRARWGGLFDEFEVDLVINGHNHNYERTHPLRAGRVTREVTSGGTVQPATDGTTYVTAGGGGQVAYQATLYPTSYVTILGARVPETAEWSATRYLDISLIAVDVEPRTAGSPAIMRIRALRQDGSQIETVTLTR